MATALQVLTVVLIAASAVLHWVLPRRFGASGLVGAQVLVAAGWVLIGAWYIWAGLWTYDDPFQIVGLLLQAFLLNCLLLPVAIAALWRRRRDRVATPKGFEVVRDSKHPAR